MDKEDKLKEIAKQLSHPSGAKGSEMATMMHATNSQMTAQAIAQLDLHAADQLLEIGHGNAAHLPAIFQINPDIQYTGLEISDLMHQEAKALNPSLQAAKSAKFILYDGTSMPFTAAAFDKIFTVNTLYFWPDPLHMFQELHRILRVDGLLAVTFALKSFMQTLPFTNYGFRLYDLLDAQVLAKAAGFTFEAADLQAEPVQSKTGEWVQRQYVTLLLRKTNT